MEIRYIADAEQYLKDYVNYQQKMLDKEPREDDKTALEICKINLGYFAGYYDHETRDRVEKLFQCSHPVYGSIKEKGAPTPTEAFNT